MKFLMELRLNIYVQLCACLISFVVELIATVTNSWLIRHFNTLNSAQDTKESTVGLFIKCSIYVANIRNCLSYPDTSDWLRCCRAMSIIACLLQLAAVIITIISMLRNKKRFLMLAAACFSSAICMLITVVVFAAMNQWTNQNFYKFNWSFILAALSIFFSTFTGTYAVAMMRASKNQPEEKIDL